MQRNANLVSIGGFSAMDAERNHNLYVAGITHNNTAPEILGKFGMRPEESTLIEAKAVSIDGISECTMLSTCNRVEFYCVAESQEKADEIIKCAYDKSAEDFAKLCFIKENAEAIEHLFEAASGLTSQMTGETEILGQVKAAYARASENGHCGRVLNAVFQKAAHCAKWIRTNTEVGRGKISIGGVCAELATRIFDDISEARILLVGSGEVGKLAAEALFVRGAKNISVCSRTRTNADMLAEKIGGTSCDIKPACENLEGFDIILAASYAKELLIHKNSVERALSIRKGKPIFLIDLAVPSNIDPLCSTLDDAYLYNLADLSKVANENLEARKAEIAGAKIEAKKRANALADKLFYK